MKEQFDVFISYRRSNGGTELANVVRNYLTSRGLRVFLDTRELIDGQYFDIQLRERLIETPNYVLIATPEAFQFRKGEDWVREEIKLAVSEFKKNPQNRSIIPFVPNGTVFPESGLPEGLEDLPRFNRILLKDTKPTGAELLRLAKAICRVNRRNMWNAGHRYLSQSKSASRRFHTLHIDERIMPLASDTPQTNHAVTLPIRVQSGEGKEHPIKLDDALKANGGHVYLIGEGGIGKTTAMISIMENAYERHSYSDTVQIPLFVELNRAPEQSSWYLTGEKLESTFIRRELGRILLSANNIVHVPADYITGLDKEFSKETTAPEYLLLLDGLNEVSTEKVQDENGHTSYIRTLIINEIIHLLTDCPNVRVMLTSRTDETEINCEEHGIVKLHLTGLDDHTIRAYLIDCKMPEEKVEESIKNDTLRECLRIPLFLTIFGKLSETKEIARRGEILRQFFHERSKKIYSQQSRIKDFHIDTNETQLLFILDFLLPAIGNYMEQKGEFYLSDESIAAVIEPILKGRIADVTYTKRTPIATVKTEKSKKKGVFGRIFGNKQAPKTVQPAYSEEIISIVPASLRSGDAPSPISFIGEYGKQCFLQYAHYRTDTAEIAREILAKGKTALDVEKYVRECSVWVLGILQESGGKYGFIHHHIRDYFAAAHDINFLRLAVMLQKEAPSFAFPAIAPLTANANHREKSIFIGEILGEHHNKPTLHSKTWRHNVPVKECDLNLLKRSLAVLRGKFGNEVGYGVYNLMEPIKLVRQDLSGADLSKMDLTLVTLNGVRLGHTENGGAIFHGAKVSMENLLCQGHNGFIKCVAYTPNGKTVLSGSSDHTIKEWDTATGQCLQTYKGHSKLVQIVACAPDGKTFISGSWDNTIKEWDRATGRCIRTYNGHTDIVTCVAYVADGEAFLSASKDGTIKKWNRATGHCVRTYKGHDYFATSLAYESQKGETFISGSPDNTIKEWDIETGKCIRTYIGHSKMVFSVGYSPDGNNIISGSNDHTIKEWDRVTGKCIRTYKGHRSQITSVSYSPDGQTIISGSDDNTIKEWDRFSGQCVQTYAGHNDNVYSVAYSPDGQTIISGSDDIREWNRYSGKCIRNYIRRSDSVTSIVFTKDGKSFFFGSCDDTVKEWNVLTGQCIRIYMGHRNFVSSVAYMSNGKLLSGSLDNMIKEWDTASGKCIYTFSEQIDSVTSLSCVPSGETFLSGSDDGKIREWNITTGKCIRTYEKSMWIVLCLAYALDGKSFISGSTENEILEWDTITGKNIHQYVGHSNSIDSLAFSPDSKTFLSGSSDKTIKEWDRSTQCCLHTYKGHNGIIRSVVYAPNAKTFISGSRDKTVKEWDRSTGKCIRTYKGHNGGISSLAYYPDGKTFLSGANDGTIRIWSTETGECLQVIQNYPGLIVLGCDMRNLHEDSQIDKDLLRQYGAIVD